MSEARTPVRVPFGDLAVEVREIRAEVDEAVARVLGSGWFVLGREVEAFESEFARWLGVGHVVSCGNGTDAITIALNALGLGRDDEVITVANTCVPTAAGIRDAGCALRLADCDPSTLQMSAASLEEMITPSTRAVVPVHLYGSSPDMDAIAAICARRGIALVEDCAQAHGTRWRDRNAGSFGAISAWSFYPSKNLGAYGDGGAIATDDATLAERARRLRNYGQRVRYYHDEEGRNSRLDEMQAAILRVKLRHLDRWNERRRAVANRYTRSLADMAGVPQVLEQCTPSRHLYPVLVENRDEVRAGLERAGIATQIHYPVPIHRQKAYGAMFPDARFPIAEHAAGRLVSLPLYPQMSDEDVDAVVAELSKFCPDAR